MEPNHTDNAVTSSDSHIDARGSEGNPNNTTLLDSSNEFAPELFGNVDLANIAFEGENDLYWVYHNPSFSLTGVDHIDWEALESQTAWP